MLLPQLLKCGISLYDYWDMTLAEMKLIVNAYKEKEDERAKEILASNYELAFNIVTFLGMTLDGKKIPSMNQMYPTAFKKVDENRKWELIGARLHEFAIEHNKRRHK